MSVIALHPVKRLLDRITLVASLTWAIVSGASWGVFSVVWLAFYRFVLAVLAICAAILFAFWE